MDSRAQVDPHPLTVVVVILGTLILVGLVGIVPVLVLSLTGIVLSVHHDLQPPEGNDG